MMNRLLILAVLLPAACTPPPPSGTTDRIISENNRIAGDWIAEPEDGSASITLTLAVSGGYIFSMNYMDIDFFIDQGISMVKQDSLTLNSMKKNTAYKTAYCTDGDTLWLDMQQVFDNGYDDEIPVDFFMKSGEESLLPFVRRME